MLTAETAPQINTPGPEQQPPADAAVETLEHQPIDEAQVALGGVSREARGSQRRSETQQARADFYSKLGEAAVSVAKTGKLGEHSVAPKGFLQRRAALKVMKKAEAVKDARSQQEHMMLVYPTTGGSSRLKPLKTVKARHQAKDTAKKQLASGQINLLEYRKRLEAARNERVYAGKITEEAIKKDHKKALDKLKKSVKYSDGAEASDTSTPAAEGSAPPQPTSAVEVAPAPQVTETSVIETAPTQGLTQAEKNVAALAKLRDAGQLPPPTSKTTEQVVSQEPETTREPEVAEEDITATAQNILLEADRLMAEQTKADEPKLNKDDLILELLEKSLVSPDGTPDSDISAKGVQILDAIHKLEAEAPEPQAEVEVVGSIETEPGTVDPKEVVKNEAKAIRTDVESRAKATVDAARAEHSKSGSTEPFDAKASWAAARKTARTDIAFALNKYPKEIRKQVLAELAKLNEEAFKKREKARKPKVEAQEAPKQSSPEPRSETVQQRARREREEKLAREREATARVNENAQRTALDL